MKGKVTSILKPSPLLGAVLVGLLLLASAGLYIWNRSGPTGGNDGLFYTALEKGITTEGVACRITETDGDRTSEQVVRLDLRSRSDATTKTTIRQHDAKVTTEGNSTSDAEYIRYLTIRTGKERSAGAKPDFSKVINVWAKQPVDAAKPTSLYGQTVLGGCVIPLADLPNDKKDTYSKELRAGKIFQTDTAKATTKKIDGTSYRAFETVIEPGPYIRFMKQLAADLELRQLESISTEQYATRKPEKVTILIDPSSREVREIRFADKQRNVRLTDYGDRPATREPAKTIPVKELQERLQSIR